MLTKQRPLVCSSLARLLGFQDGNEMSGLDHSKYLILRILCICCLPCLGQDYNSEGYDKGPDSTLGKGNAGGVLKKHGKNALKYENSCGEKLATVLVFAFSLRTRPAKRDSPSTIRIT